MGELRIKDMKFCWFGQAFIQVNLFRISIKISFNNQIKNNDALTIS